jgi:chemotaxis protein histidine kinase CheA/CheY-like chemotaxis protein
LGKLVSVRIDAGATELEPDVLDAISEPILHLVRNAVDHGIEPAGERGDKPASATLVLAAEAHGATVVVRVEDDGTGLDPQALRESAVARGLVAREAAERMTDDEALELAFLHGLSTRTEVSELSGRGVGLDVVRRRVEAIGGTARVRSAQGVGTAVVLTVPMRISRERVLVVGAGPMLYGLPVGAVRTVLRRSDAALETVAGRLVMAHEGERLPVASMTSLLGGAGRGEEPFLLVLAATGKSWAILVDSVEGEVSVLRRRADAPLARFPAVAASSVLDDGRPLLFAHVPDLVRRFGAGLAPLRSAATRRRPRALVVDDSPVVQELLRELLQQAGLEVTLASDGLDALARLDETWPDLVLCDLEMPHMDGFELLARIRSRSRELPVIMVTTRGSLDDRRRASELGADAYVVKSEIGDDALLSAVRRFAEVVP